MKEIVIALVRVYQLVISPCVPSHCRFQPTCSQYAIDALRRYGLLGGLWRTARRLLRCHPWGAAGHDPVT